VITLVDMRFSSSGHYIDDLLSMCSLLKGEEIKYLANGDGKAGAQLDSLSNIECSFILRSYAFYWRLFWMLWKGRNQKLIFLSCSYFQLFLLSVVTKNFYYYFRIHSLPVKWVWAYRYVISALSRMSRGAIFLDYPVKDWFNEEGIVSSSRSNVLIGRAIPIPNRPIIQMPNVPRVAFIGSINSEKDVGAMLSGLGSGRVGSYRISLYSKGIKNYAGELIRMQRAGWDIDFEDQFYERVRLDELYRKSDIVVLPYRYSYGVRFSAVLNDALRNGCVVIAPELPQFVYYSREFGVVVTSSMRDLPRAIGDVVKKCEFDFRPLALNYGREVMLNQIGDLEL
jgi:glycosyltransferase involved in cell wall biosynthesis